MTEPRDMEAPVTRRELHETLDLWGGAFEQRMLERMDERFQVFEHRFRALEERVDRRIVALFEHFEARFMTDMRAQVRGALEDVTGRISAVDDKYGQLPARVTRLEAKVFPPKKPRRRRAG